MMQAICLARRNDYPQRTLYYARMAAPGHDWYLKQWLRTLGKKQADVAKDLEWNKAKVSLTASGKQPYTRDDVNEIADYLNLRPYELLMHPDDAMRMRQLRAEMMRLAHEAEDDVGDSDGEPNKPKRVSLG